ncbi:hypothetical protein FS749_011794 [Ceratobasidium sp. UAMH 11750]|nr:hypothetical protein FS749_011794 [Ceratobasidium sp. UAMH 11750]
MSEPYGKAVASPTSLSDIISVLIDHGCTDITLSLDPNHFSEYPTHGGGFGDIYSGRTTTGTKVAVKCARYGVQDDKQHKILKLVAREIHTWSKCKHENVLELYGLAQHRGQLAMVSPWMENGSLPEYIAKNPGVDRLDLVRQTFLLDLTNHWASVSADHQGT